MSKDHIVHTIIKLGMIVGHVGGVKVWVISNVFVIGTAQNNHNPTRNVNFASSMVTLFLTVMRDMQETHLKLLLVTNTSQQMVTAYSIQQRDISSIHRQCHSSIQRQSPNSFQRRDTSNIQQAVTNTILPAITNKMLQPVTNKKC